ncbi:unnamed protein product, partial [Timema podura]|nr:unnamed protein product [Timema podura]
MTRVEGQGHEGVKRGGGLCPAGHISSLGLHPAEVAKSFLVYRALPPNQTVHSISEDRECGSEMCMVRAARQDVDESDDRFQIATLKNLSALSKKLQTSDIEMTCAVSHANGVKNIL